MTRAMCEPPRSYIAEPGAFGIRPEPAASIARRHGGQIRRAPGRGRMRGQYGAANCRVVGERLNLTLDLEEASIACRKEGGAEPPL